MKTDFKKKKKTENVSLNETHPKHFQEFQPTVVLENNCSTNKSQSNF